MLFNSLEFALFLPAVFVLYWYVFKSNTKLQNVFILAASYTFYGWWDWRFLSLIIVSSVCDFVVGLLLDREELPRKRRILLGCSLSVNLGLLGFFKYFDFFVDAFVDAFLMAGVEVSGVYLNVILPVGISFYTFQTLSYTIDIYRGKIGATRDPIAFFTFVAFFPQLVAGPIERASNLLPQFGEPRTFDYGLAKDGTRQILLGFFKKVVIADTCATYANHIFGHFDSYPGSVLLLGTVYFAFQIYGDFSGYSDIAIGTSRLFGIDLKRNFSFPYFSRDIAEFWRRWHISLSTWFRDYVYIPLGGSRGSRSVVVKNILVVFVVSGLWHGANWTFIAWGLLNGLLVATLYLLGRHRKHVDTVASETVLPSLTELFQMGSTFFVTLVAWVFFRADSISHAFAYLQVMFSSSILRWPTWGLTYLPLLAAFLAWEWAYRHKVHSLQIDGLPKGVRQLVYLVVISTIASFIGDGQEFIYFQF